MFKKLKLIIGNFTLLILLFASSIQPAAARLIFVDDVFENNSETYQIGSDDDAATISLSLDFGGINSETITWDTTAFTISDDLGVEGDLSQDGTTFTLDSDNTGPGANVDIVADQGSDNPGTLRYNSLNNRWEISNDGGTFEAISTGGGSTLNLDDAYNNFAASPSVVYIDANEGQTGGLKFAGSLAGDETITIKNTGNGGVLAIKNQGTGLTFGLYNSFSTTSTEWQIFDDGTNEISILTGTDDPTITAVDANVGSIFLNSDNGHTYTKMDDGSTTNWEKSGITDDLWDAFEGTAGTPSSTNKFVTNDDTRLVYDSDNDFGEISLGSRLDYPGTLQPINNSYIYYIRVYLPSNSNIHCIGIFTTQVKTGDINFGIYSNDTGGPLAKLAETGAQINTSSPDHGFWHYELSTPFEITTSDFYWIALATTEAPKTATYPNANDRFIPYRVETKVSSSTTLPATPNLDTLGNSINLPYIAAFDGTHDDF